jgi:predicted regulator of Ras-like GTPase activity (Roadblock/LC7/MglB family)
MFKEALHLLLQGLPGARSASVMGFDGIAIDSVDAADATGQEQSAAIELAAVASQLKRASEGLGAGDVREVALETEQQVTLLRPLTAEYLLAVTVGKDGYVGQARYRMRVVAPKFAAELG